MCLSTCWQWNLANERTRIFVKDQVRSNYLGPTNCIRGFLDLCYWAWLATPAQWFALRSEKPESTSSVRSFHETASLWADSRRPPISHSRGIEWSLRAFASMRAVRLFLRARAVINFLIESSEHFRKLSADWNLSFLKRFAPSNLADTFKTGQQEQS